MARVEEKGGLLVKLSDMYTRKAYGRAITTTPVIAHSPSNMLGWGALEFGTERAHKVDERLKLLAATRAATMIGCQFCIDIGTALGREAGVSEEQIRDFHSYRESSAFTRVEKLVMEYAEEMSKEQVDIPDELFAGLCEHFDDAQLVELTAAIAIENFRARFNNALDVPAAGFSEGAVCPVPDSVARGAAQSEGDQDRSTEATAA
jgi:AhpD family alkylhydroperoxidase